MITVKKIYTLKPRTQVRKVSTLFYEAARNNLSKEESDIEYLKDVFNVLYGDAAKSVIDEENYARIDRFKLKLETGATDRILYEDISQMLLAVLGSEPSDWDFVTEYGELDGDRRTILHHSLILDRLRSPFNVGSVFRSSDSFGVDKITVVEGTASPTHKRSIRTSRGTTETVDYTEMSEDDLIEELKKTKRPIFALELGGKNINEFDFPSDGIAVIGSEEFGVSDALLKLCDSSLGRVSIPLAGSKGSINVSVATGIMLQAWFANETEERSF
jgi:TrmH family RNA methyltransferase